MDALDNKLNDVFAGHVVPKDLGGIHFSAI
jgi:hypothetical protein